MDIKWILLVVYNSVTTEESSKLKMENISYISIIVKERGERVNQDAL